MIPYNPTFLDNTKIFDDDEIALLDDLNNQVPLSYFLSNKSFVDKYGIDFVHTSAKIEGNTYDKKDTYALIEYGRTAGGKMYSEAKMILNMRDAYNVFISQDLVVNKQTLKDLHYILADEMILDSEKSTPRNEEVAIKGCDYIPLATSNRLDDELNYMLSMYDKIQNPYDKALYIHCNLAYLQYFKDCNKRTARMMLNVSLKANNKMLYIPDEEQISNYLQSIIIYYESGDYKPFKEYFISTYTHTINSLLAIKNQRLSEAQSFRS